jgi:molybdenum cofactor cytidylyltransferase
LGEPKQLLPYKGSTLLGATLDTARRCGFDQILVTVGASWSELRLRVDFGDCQVVENEQFESGCSSSIGAAIGMVDPGASGIILLLGDQPDVSNDVVRDLVRAASGSALGVCRYEDGVGHPFWFGRQVFDELLSLHGDKAVWKLLESGRHAVVQVDISGKIPLDVDTWEDYAALLAGASDGNVL